MTDERVRWGDSRRSNLKPKCTRGATGPFEEETLEEEALEEEAKTLT